MSLSSVASPSRYGTLTELAGVDMVDHKSEKANAFLKQFLSKDSTCPG